MSVAEQLLIDVFMNATYAVGILTVFTDATRTVIAHRTTRGFPKERYQQKDAENCSLDDPFVAVAPQNMEPVDDSVHCHDLAFLVDGRDQSIRSSIDEFRSPNTHKEHTSCNEEIRHRKVL